MIVNRELRQFISHPKGWHLSCRFYVNEDRNKKVKEYVKEHWKEFQRSKEYRNESAKKTRRYKQDLYKKGLI